MMQKFDILELIPQRRPFVMVDELVHYDPVVTRTRFTVAPECIFVEDGRLSEFGLVENIAQTCAARMGYMNLTGGEGVKIGFIGAIKRLEILRLPEAGSLLETTIEVVGEVMALTLVNARVECGGEVLARCEMKIAINDE